MRRWVFPLSGVLLLGVLASTGCAGSRHTRAGERAERAGNHDDAVTFYARALRENPDDPYLRSSLQRARLRASQSHALMASRLLEASEMVDARKELEIALALNPTDSTVRQQLLGTEAALAEAGENARRGSIDALKQQIRASRFAGLTLPAEAVEPAEIIFRDTSVRDTLLTLGKMVGVNVVFDSAFRDQSISIELESATFEQAFDSLCRITRNFYRIHADNVITVIPDTTEKRREYEQQAARTFYLSNADLKETVDLLRIVLGARRIAAQTANNAFTMVDSPERLSAAEAIVDTIDKTRGEVVVEVELLEVNRSRMDEYGIQLRSLTGDGITTAVFPSDTTLDESLYSRSNLGVGGLPGALLTLLRIDGDTRVLANPRLRAVDGQPALAEFGERVPVPITTFTPIATGGIAQQPVTTFQYENIGVSINITPRVHHDNEVSLALEVRLDNISGTGFGDLPTFGNRNVNTVLRLADGETSLLAGLIREEERTSLTGTPGLASIPVIGRLFAANRKEVQTSDIVLTLTPRIVRQPNLTVEDLRPYLIEGASGSDFLFEPTSPLPRREPNRNTNAQEEDERTPPPPPPRRQRQQD